MSSRDNEVIQRGSKFERKRNNTERAEESGEKKKMKKKNERERINTENLGFKEKTIFYRKKHRCIE